MAVHGTPQPQQGLPQPGIEAILQALFSGGQPVGNIVNSPPILGGVPGQQAPAQPQGGFPQGFPLALLQGLSQSGPAGLF